MGDVGDDFRAFREAKKQRAAANLEKAEKQDWPVDWNYHSPWHWSCRLAGKRLDYWPTKNKFQYDGRISCGGLRGFINKRLVGEK